MLKKTLILGQPGSGKTIMLLRLAEALLAEAEAKSDRPVPVVLPLASWANKQLPLENIQKNAVIRRKRRS